MMSAGAYLSVKDELWSFKQMKVPDSDYAIWIIDRRWILVICRRAEFRVLQEHDLSMYHRWDN
jgi:hypothetical protein